MGQRIVVRVPLFVLLAIALLSCGDSSATEDYELSGFITRLGSEEGVRGATVRFTSNTLRVNETQTNGNGFYEMVVTTDSLFGQVRATAEGFQPNEETVFFDTTARRVDIQLRPEGGFD